MFCPLNQKLKASDTSYQKVMSLNGAKNKQISPKLVAITKNTGS